MSSPGFPGDAVLNRRSARPVAALAEAALASTRRASSAEEEGWIARIERCRAELDSSADPLVRLDYGAGDADSERTEEQMVAGVEVSEPLGRFTARASMSPTRCLALFRIVRSVRPESCIELGTAVGISAAYQAAALELNGRGSLATLEGARPLAQVAERTLHGLGLHRVEVVVGRFADTLPGVLERRRPVDFVLVDGHHDERALLGYWRLLLASLSDPALVVVDDIDWSSGMERAWRAITLDERAHCTFELGSLGLCVVGTSRARDGRPSYPPA